MTIEERLALLEKEVAELKGQVSAQPQVMFQSDEKLVSVIIRTDKRKYEITDDYGCPISHP